MFTHILNITDTKLPYNFKYVYSYYKFYSLYGGSDEPSDAYFFFFTGYYYSYILNACNYLL